MEQNFFSWYVCIHMQGDRGYESIENEYDLKAHSCGRLQ